MKFVCMVSFALLLALAPHPALSATYYVRTAGSNSQCNGLTDADYSAAVAPKCAFATIGGTHVSVGVFGDNRGKTASLHGCVGAMSAGDTCLVHAGTYTEACVDTGGNNAAGSFHIEGKSGTSAAPITIKGFPGDTAPKLCAGNDLTCTPNPACATILLYRNASYWRFEGLHLMGVTRFGNNDSYNTVTNVAVSGSEFEGGGGCDGNYPMIYLDETSNIQIDHNLFHNLNFGTCVNPGNWATMYKAYHDVGTTLEYNTFQAGTGVKRLTSILNPKSCPKSLTVRYNLIEDGPVYFNTTAHTPCKNTGTSSGQPGNIRFYGNVVSRGAGTYDYQGMQFGILSNDNAPRILDTIQIYSNTFYKGVLALYQDDTADPAQIRNLLIRDNAIVSNSTASNLVIQKCAWTDHTGWSIDYNGYDPQRNWVSCQYGCGAPSCTDTSYATLTNWKSTSFDTHAPSLPTGGCVLTAPASGNYSIVAGTPCATASSTGGKLGYEGVTSCVGHLCGTSGSPNSPPPPPTNVARQDKH